MAGVHTEVVPFQWTPSVRLVVFFFSSRRRHTRCSRDWSSDVCSSDLFMNQSGRLESVLTAFPAQVVGRHPAQIFIEERNQLGDRIGIAGVDLPEQSSDILQGSSPDQSLARNGAAKGPALLPGKRPTFSPPRPRRSADSRNYHFRKYREPFRTGFSRYGLRARKTQRPSNFETKEKDHESENKPKGWALSGGTFEEFVRKIGGYLALACHRRPTVLGAEELSQRPPLSQPVEIGRAHV